MMRAFDPHSLPHPAVTVDVILFTVSRRGLESPLPRDRQSRLALPPQTARSARGEGVLKVLLIRRQLPPFEGRWALPGGFVRMEESLDEAARRELLEEAGIEVRWLEQLYTFGDPKRDPARRAITVCYFALIDAHKMELRAGTDATQAAWFPMSTLPKLAFDHGKIVAMALERLRYKTEYAPVAFQLLPRTFTLSELQEVYEAILERPLDKRNFRRKILSLDIVAETGESRSEGRGRPAALFKFRMDRFRDLGGGVVLAF